MKSRKKRLQKFHTDDASLAKCSWLVEVNFPRETTYLKHSLIWEVTRRQYGISALVPQTSFRWDAIVGVGKCRQCSQVNRAFSPTWPASMQIYWTNRKHLHCKATCKWAQQLPTMLGVVSQQYCVRLHGAKSLTGFKLCATTSNNMQQGVQTDARCNIQQYWELLVNNVASVCTQPKRV